MLLLVVAGIVMFVLTSLQSYTLSDDVLYHCIWRWTSKEDFSRIGSFSDIIRSQVIHYQVLTGRVVVQFVAQTFLALLCKPVYDVANALVFVLTAWMSARYASGGKPIRAVTVMMVLFIMMVMIPGFVDDYLWIEGSMNYLWVSLAMMGMVFVFEKNDGRDATWKDYAVSPLMLLVGWTHEGAAVPLAVALVAHCALRRNVRRCNAALPYVAWFTVGAFLCALAPSTVLRAIGGEGHVAASPLTKVALGLFTCTEMRTVWLLAIVMAYAYKRQKRLLVWHVRRYDYLYMAVILCIGVIFASGVTQPRVCYFAEFFSMLLVVNLLLRMGIARHSAKMAVAMGTVMALVLIPGIYYSYEGHVNYKYIMAQIAKGDTDIIRVRQVMGCNYFIRKFTFPQVEFGPNTYYFAPDSTDENVRCAATLLGRERLVFLPDDMVGKIMDNSDSYIAYGESMYDGMLAMQIPTDKKVERVTFVLGEDTPPFYKRPFMYGGYTYDAPRWQVIEVNGRNFVFFDKPVPKIFRRVKDIKIS